MTMEPQVWSREEIRALVQGRMVNIQSPLAEVLAIPDWLLEGSLGPAPVAGTDALNMALPADRARLVEWYMDALERPGELVEIDVHYDVDGEWVGTNVRMVNLCHQPEIGGLLTAAEYDYSVVVAPRPDVARLGEYE